MQAPSPNFDIRKDVERGLALSDCYRLFFCFFFFRLQVKYMKYSITLQIIHFFRDVSKGILKLCRLGGSFHFYFFVVKRSRNTFGLLTLSWRTKQYLEEPRSDKEEQESPRSFQSQFPACSNNGWFSTDSTVLTHFPLCLNTQNLIKELSLIQLLNDHLKSSSWAFSC